MSLLEQHNEICRLAEKLISELQYSTGRAVTSSANISQVIQQMNDCTNLLGDLYEQTKGIEDEWLVVPRPAEAV